MERVERFVNAKRNAKTLKLVCEHYLREDIPCKSDLCQQHCEQVAGCSTLSEDATHYLLPSHDVAESYFEILQLTDLTDIIFLQTVSNHLQERWGKRQFETYKQLLREKEKHCVAFANEHHVSCYIHRDAKQSAQEWKFQNIYSAAKWFYSHTEKLIPIVIVTEDEKFITQQGSESTGIFVMKMSDYLTCFWPDLQEAHELYESLSNRTEHQSNIGAAICKEYRDYLPKEVLHAGIKSGRFVSNYLKVNKHNPIQEAFVKTSDSKETRDILIPGTAYRNRAIDGDLVVVEILPENKWKSKRVSLTQRDDKDTNDGASKPMITGCVVGVLERNLRDFVVVLQEDVNVNTGGKFLTIPWDVKIPKIRVHTRQASHLKDDRFVVRIDSWYVTSLYPNGHFVRIVGPIGNVETELVTILLEHSLTVETFSENVLEEMPDAKEWKVDQHEVLKRRDLRESHLIFSIDPQGCEDVDDTLSVRELENGEIELGVHIADVTHFVKHNSFTDLQAREKSTTVYLADRRYDMLPEVLSAHLCSLISEVDRYAVSVVWTLDKKFDVKDVWYGRTVIRSKYKLFYEAAQRISENDVRLMEIANVVPELKDLNVNVLKKRYSELQKSIRLLMKVARHLKAQRSSNGAVALESTEVQFSMTPSTTPASPKQIDGLLAKAPLEVHETIAECMIFANHWVAKKIRSQYKNHALLRHHPAPAQEAFKSLKQCATATGFQVDTKSNEMLAISLDSSTSDDANVNKVLRMLATQAMMVASYFSTGSLEDEKHSHYGLALDAYTHFTSPIRRYADVLVHRLLLASINDPSSEHDSLIGNQHLQKICEHMNVKHREADHAQKDSVQLFLTLFFKSNDTEDSCVVDAMVYSLRTNGCLVFIPKYGIKGVVFMKNKEGKVAVQRKTEVVFESGSLQQLNDRIVITDNSSKRSVYLFSYLKVRIEVNSVKTHLETLNFQLVSFLQQESNDKHQVKVERHDMIKDVKEEETIRIDKQKHQSGTNTLFNAKLHPEYAQTHPSVSLYHMFASFKKIALQERKK